MYRNTYKVLSMTQSPLDWNFTLSSQYFEREGADLYRIWESSDDKQDGVRRYFELSRFE